MNDLEILLIDADVEIVPVYRVFSGFVFYSEFVVWRSTCKFTSVDGQCADCGGLTLVAFEKNSA